MIGWFDGPSGVSGDMMLGALVGAGVPLPVLQDAVAALQVGVALSARAVVRAGLAAVSVTVAATERRPPARTLPDVRALLDAAPLEAPVRDRARMVFELLAQAEATVHGIEPTAVHFHELGALDTLADVVGACAGLAHLGLKRVGAGPVSVGGGTVQAAHGLLPVPGPAVLEILRRARLPVRLGGDRGELATPTGAALLAVWADPALSAPPPLVPAVVGVGAGSRDLPDQPNVLRLVLGEPAPVGGEPADPADLVEPAVLLAANVDDMDPRVWPHVLAQLLGAGAADAWLTPILMKKGRPAHTVTVLSAPARAATLRRLLMIETSTIGVRESRVDKHALARTETTVSIEGNAVRIKLAELDGVVVNAGPEWDDVAAAARASGRPPKAVLAAASAAAADLLGASRRPTAAVDAPTGGGAEDGPTAG